MLFKNLYIIVDITISNTNIKYDNTHVKIEKIVAHPTNPVEGCADANPKTELPNDT